MFCSCYFLSSKIKYISMQFSVEITMNLYDQVLILALNILKVSHLDVFFYHVCRQIVPVPEVSMLSVLLVVQKCITTKLVSFQRDV